MPKYSVKIGEIHLVATRPITEEERVRAIQQFIADWHLGTSPDGLDIMGLINVETLSLRKR